jgi:predicted transposase YdaD
MHEMLRETPIYQEILREGRREGLEVLRQAVLDVIAQRFPELERLAKKQVVIVVDPELLRQVIVKVSVVHTAEEAKQQLLALNEVDE